MVVKHWGWSLQEGLGFSLLLDLISECLSEFSM